MAIPESPNPIIHHPSIGVSYPLRHDTRTLFGIIEAHGSRRLIKQYNTITIPVATLPYLCRDYRHELQMLWRV